MNDLDHPRISTEHFLLCHCLFELFFVIRSGGNKMKLPSRSLLNIPGAWPPPKKTRTHTHRVCNTTQGTHDACFVRNVSFCTRVALFVAHCSRPKPAQSLRLLGEMHTWISAGQMNDKMKGKVDDFWEIVNQHEVKSWHWFTLILMIFYVFRKDWIMRLKNQK